MGVGARIARQLSQELVKGTADYALGKAINKVGVSPSNNASSSISVGSVATSKGSKKLVASIVELGSTVLGNYANNPGIGNMAASMSRFESSFQSLTELSSSTKNTPFTADPSQFLNTIYEGLGFLEKAELKTTMRSEVSSMGACSGLSKKGLFQQYSQSKQNTPLRDSAQTFLSKEDPDLDVADEAAADIGQKQQEDRQKDSADKKSRNKI